MLSRQLELILVALTAGAIGFLGFALIAFLVHYWP